MALKDLVAIRELADLYQRQQEILVSIKALTDNLWNISKIIEDHPDFVKYASDDGSDLDHQQRCQAFSVATRDEVPVEVAREVEAAPAEVSDAA